MGLARSEPAGFSLRRRLVFVIAVGLVGLAQLAYSAPEWSQPGSLQDGPLAVFDCEDSADSAVWDDLVAEDESDDDAPQLAGKGLGRSLAHVQLVDRGHNSSCRDAILSISPKTGPPTA